MPQEKAKLYYFFSVSYAVQTPGGNYFVAKIMRSDKPQITAMDLQSFQASAQIPENSTLLAISVLGRMTQEQFNPAPREAVATPEAYRKGVEAGMYTPNQKCPYPEDTLEYRDYHSGFVMAQSIIEKQPTQG